MPDLRDIHTTLKLLQMLGCACEYADGKAEITPGALLPEAPYELVSTMRASGTLPRAVAGPHRAKPA